VQEHFNAKVAMEAPEADQSDLSRADFLKIAAWTGGALAIGEVFLKGRPISASASERSPGQDANILGFLLTLEYLQASFYRDAIDKGALNGDLARFAQVAGDHEQSHVTFIRKQLGATATQRPAFDFGDATSTPEKFTSTAIKLEELGLRAYVGQGANLTRHAVLQIARIASVEGRHAAWIRDIHAQLPAPNAADPGAAQREVATAIRATGFTKGGA
jgi:hypothetical protein